MRPITLVLAAVITVAAAYAVVFWRNASDVKQQMENEQGEVAPEDLRYSSPPSEQPSPSFTDPPEQQGGEPTGTSGATTPVGGAVEATSEEGAAVALQASESTPDLASESPEAPAFDVEAEQKRLNYAALENTSNRIGIAIQRQLREGEILGRGRGLGAVLLRHLGYSLNAAGQHETPDGTISVEVKGPDLIVLTATSEELGNQLEMSIIGPRDVDRRVRRVR